MTTLGVIVHEGKTLGGGPDEARRQLSERGWTDVRWEFVPKSKRAPARVRKMLDSGIDRLLVWGGDGTVRRCIDTIVAEDAKVEVAILPAGTANHLAKAVGVPGDLAGALDVALDGTPRPIDVGVANDEVFAVMAGAGFDALMIRDTDDAGKARFGNLSYVKAAARHLQRPGTMMKVDIDGTRWFHGRAACVLVGNVGRIIGGIDVFPDASLEDGRLDIGIVTAQRRRDWARVGIRAVLGRIDHSPFVEVASGSEVRIKLEDKLPWELDGGTRDACKRIDVVVLPTRVPIMVPVS